VTVITPTPALSCPPLRDCHYTYSCPLLPSSSWLSLHLLCPLLPPPRDYIICLILHNYIFNNYLGDYHCLLLLFSHDCLIVYDTIIAVHRLCH